MSHQDTDCHTASITHHQALKNVLEWLLVPARLSDVTFRDSCSWTPKALVFTAILWAWSDEKALTERFVLARKVVIAMRLLTGTPARSYQAFLKILRTWTTVLATMLVAAFRQRMEADLAERFHLFGFAVFGVDGSRLELPRTESNQRRFSPPKTRRSTRSKSRRKARRRSDDRAHRKNAENPQMWLTTMFHVGTGLPWDWRSGPSNSSERDHLRRMIAALPAEALITADAGFAGYETWKAILDTGRHLLIRVGSNVCLLKGLGYVREFDGVVYLWPDREVARRRPPLVLRLVKAHNGKHPAYLVTSVLDKGRLSDAEVVEIYALRWGLEMFYRHVKQTFERRKLRGHNADNAELEATWSLLGLWTMSLHAKVELSRLGVPARRISVAKFLRAYRRCLREYKSSPDAGESLNELLQKAVIDGYHRSNKSSRAYPRKKQGHAIGAPEVRDATNHQIDAATQIRRELQSWLTA
jgi:hypothetical protein